MQAEYDIVIVGSGLIGATLALNLAQVDPESKIALIDGAKAMQAPKGSKISLRVNAYNRASERLLNDLGVWTSISDAFKHGFDKVEVSSFDSDARVYFDAGLIDEPHIGHFIENERVVYHVQQALQGCDNIHWHQETDGISVVKPNRVTDPITLCTSKCDFAAQLLVGADGPRSWLRSVFNVPVKEQVYGQKCIVGAMRFSQPNESTAWQRFLPSGPLGMLPLSGGKFSLAWSANDTAAEELLALDDDTFAKRLTLETQGRFGEVIDVEQRAAFPLVAKHADDYVGQRWALMGDAAHAIHPLSGLGANLGFIDVLAFVRAYQNAKSSGRDIGSQAMLLEYERARRNHNGKVLNMMTCFNKVFCNETNWAKKIRPWGMTLANRFDFAKRRLLQQAAWMGEK